jgi:hypothetical protein
MEPTVEKDEFGEVVHLGFIPTEKRCIFVERKIIQAFSYLATRNGNPITIRNQLIKIDHMVGNGLERNEYLGCFMKK